MAQQLTPAALYRHLAVFTFLLVSLSAKQAICQPPAGAIDPLVGQPASDEFFIRSYNTYFDIEVQQYEGFFATAPYFELGATTFFLDDVGSFVFSADGRVSTEGGGSGGSLGIQRRWLVNGMTVVGAGIHADMTHSLNDNFYGQAGASLEVFHGMWGARVNSYVPVGDNTNFVSLTDPAFTNEDPFFQGNNVLAHATQTQTDEIAMEGVEFQISRSFFDLSNEFYVGYYHLEHDSGVEADGWKAGARGWVLPNLVANVSVAEDDVSGTNIYGGFTWFFGRGAPQIGPISTCDLLKVPVQRERQVAITESNTIQNVDITLTNDSNPIRILHVDDDGVGTGDGTFENPYGSLTDANADADKANFDIVLVHPDTTFDDQSFTLADGQQLLGEGDNNRHVIDTDQRGQIFLPDAVDRTLDRPEINNASGTAITLADNSTVSNFDINDAATALAATGLANGNVNANRLRIMRPGRGIDIDGSDSDDGAYTFTDVTIDDATDIALRINGGEADVNFGSTQTDNTLGLYGASSINQDDNGTALSVSGGHTGTLTMAAGSSIAATDGDGLQFDNADGTYDFDGTITLNGGDAGIDIINDSDGAFNFANTTITDPTGVAFLVDGGDGNINYNGGSINKANAGNIIDIQNRAGGLIDFNVGVNASGVAGGINIAGATGENEIRFDGTVNLGNSGNRLTGGDAVTIDNNAQADAEVLFANLNVFTNGDIGLVASNGGSLTINGGQIDTVNEQAIDIDGVALDVTLANVDVNGSPSPGIEVINSDGEVTLNSVDIDNTTGAGIRLANNTTSNFTIGGGTIDGTTGDGIESVNTSNLTIDGVLIGQSSAVAGDGVSIENTDGNTRKVTVTDNNIRATGNALNITNTGAGDLEANLSGNRLESTGTAAADVDGSTGTGTLYITAFEDVVVEGNGTGNGGLIFNEVTFDAVPGGAINPVDADTLTIGATGDPVQGIGADFQNVTGSLSIDRANIFTNGGVALNLNAPATSLTVSVGDGTIEAAGADAIVLNDVESFSLNSTVVNNGGGFNTVNTTDSGLSGTGNTAATFNSNDGGGNSGTINFNGGADTVP